MSEKYSLRKMLISAMLLAIALVLPFFTGQIQVIGNALCPMHLPVLLCGFLCGPWYGLLIGFSAPLLRFALFGMPPVIPIGIAMCFELAAYGFVSGSMYRILPKRKKNIYMSLIAAMISGRVIWGAVKVLLYGFGKTEFGWQAFISGALFNAVPGIALQIILIPVLVMAVEKAFPEFIPDKTVQLP